MLVNKRQDIKNYFFIVKQSWLMKSKKLINKVMKLVNKHLDIKNIF